MSSILNFLDTSLSIDQNEGTAEQNYQYQKETLHEMYNEQKEQLKDAALQALPFGVAEASRAIHGAWETKNRIFAFKEKYSPQLEAFKAKASEMFDNIGKESGQAVDYTELLKSGATKLGRQALELAAPEVLKRTGVDLNKALNISKGEGGLQSGLNNLKEQGIDIATNKITRISETGLSRVREAIEPVVGAVKEAIVPLVVGVPKGPSPLIGSEKATNPRLRALGESSVNKETINPLFEGLSEETLAKHTETISGVASSATDQALKVASEKAKGIIDTFKAGKTQLEAKFNETDAKLTEARANVERLQASVQAQPTAVSEIPKRAMYPAERGKTPLVTQSKTNPELEAAKAEVATHEATIESLKTQASQLKTTASTAFEDTQKSVSSFAGKAFEAGKGVLGVGGEALGVFGAVQSGQDLARGNVGAQQGFNDTTGLYFGAKSVQGTGSRVLSAVQSKLSSALDKSKQIITEETNKTLAYEGKAQEVVKGTTATENKPISVENKPLAEGGKVSINPEAAIKSAELPVGSEAESLAGKALAENLGKTAGEQIGKTLGIGLAEQGAEIGAAAASASAIPVVGEAIDIGLGLYTAITAIVDLFKSPPKPPPPPQPQQQVVSVIHQQGIY